MIQIQLTLNEKPLTIQVEEGETLLEMLRERLDMTGTKRGCEVGECGACTVLIDGVPTDSCLYLAALADGKHVLTIEGIEQNNELAAIQKTFVEMGAIQCGFCTPGYIMTSYALLQKNLHPTADEIRRALAGNMCRCAAYGQIIEAIQAAGDLMEKQSGTDVNRQEEL